MRLVLVHLALQICATTGWAQPARERDPVLLGLISQALERNTEFRAAHEEWLASRSRAGSADALRDPVVTIALENEGWAPSLGSSEMGGLSVMISQDLPSKGERALRRLIARRQVDTDTVRLDRLRRQLTADVERAYTSLLLARELSAIALDQQRLWEQIENATRARYAAGAESFSGLLRTQVERTRVEQTVMELQSEARLRTLELNRLTSRDLQSELETATALSITDQAIDMDETLRRALVETPEIALADSAVEIERLNTVLARAEARPDFSVQAGYVNRGGRTGLWQVGIGLSLPRGPKRRATIGAAEANLRSAELKRKSQIAAAEYRVNERVERLQLSKQVIQLYEQGVIPQSQLAVDATLASYAAGSERLTSVMDALLAFHNARALLAKEKATHELLCIALEEGALGVDLGSPSMRSTPAVTTATGSMR